MKWMLPGTPSWPTTEKPWVPRMSFSIISYLVWVFPVKIKYRYDNVIYKGQAYTSERDLIVALYTNYLSLPEKYYQERGFDKIWNLVNTIAGEDLLAVALGNEIAGIAWRKGVVDRLDKIVIVHEDAAAEYYWCLSRGNDRALMNFLFRYMSKTFKEMVFGGSMKSLIQSFHDKKREEFMRRFRLVNPEQADILDECLNDSEVEKFLKRDAEFMPILRQRLMDGGHGAAVDFLTAGDLGL